MRCRLLGRTGLDVQPEMGGSIAPKLVQGEKIHVTNNLGSR